jgi:hypothetical protein
MKNTENKPFKIDINLDDPNELEEFIEKYKNSSGQIIANQLKLKGKGSALLAKALSNYAWNKKTAIYCRVKGKINRALKYEKICDNIYVNNIEPVCECW